MSIYRFDPHVHTAESSRCGWIPAAEMAQIYRASGFSGIAITDHLHETYVESLDCRDDWDACVDQYLAGYRAARARGEQIGLDVVLGLELRFPDSDRDYLVFGVDEGFLHAHPYPFRMGLAAFHAAFGNELLIVHAHPYRNNDLVFPHLIHGAEAVNGNPRHNSRNERALALCEEYALLPFTGSDAHRPGDEARAWLEFDRRIEDSYALSQAAFERAYRLGGTLLPEIVQAANRLLTR